MEGDMRAVLVLVSGLLAGCASEASTGLATSSAAVSVAPGMTRDQVTKALGAPTSFLTERNGVECLVYAFSEPINAGFGTSHLRNSRERLMILKGGNLIQSQVINVSAAPNVYVQMPGTATSASACADAASKA
jgi:outer membrane protein assembly factor BamE (lipoprotein component of BamABCDE complex)